MSLNKTFRFKQVHLKTDKNSLENKMHIKEWLNNKLKHGITINWKKNQNTCWRILNVSWPVTWLHFVTVLMVTNNDSHSQFLSKYGAIYKKNKNFSRLLWAASRKIKILNK